MENKLFLVTTVGTYPSTFNKKYGFERSNSLRGLSIQEKRKWTKEDNLPKPKRKILFNKNNIIIHEAFFEYNEGVIIIEAQDHKKAYGVYTLMKYYLDSFKREGSYFLDLEEIQSIPLPSYTLNKFLKLFYRCADSFIDNILDEIIHDFLHPKLYCFCQQIIKCIEFIKNVYEDNTLVESIKHYLESTSLYGIWPSQVTYDDYLRDFKSYKTYRENDYNENGFRYQLAFIAAFKGLECFFNVNDFDKDKYDIPKKIENIGIDLIKPNIRYTYMFEKDAGQIRIDSLEEIIRRYREMRNVSGAHNNKNIPLDKKIYKESVYEIQTLLRKLIQTKIHNVDYMDFSY